MPSGSGPALSCCGGVARPAPAGRVPTRVPGLVNRARPARLISLPGGRFLVGTNRTPLPEDGEGPPRRVEVRPFAIDPHAVTNEWFAAFVAETGYETEAECFGWSLVFQSFAPEGAPGAPSWWRRVDGASWRQPEGPGSGLSGRGEHPVLHVSWNDALAFAVWAGGRLPSEAEWEYAASGGRDGARYPWGEREPDETGFHPCNIWQGDFPGHDTGADGHVGVAPVHAFQPNGFGLFNTVGNAWEWCADAFRIRSLRKGARGRNAEAQAGGMRLLKGGSYLCHRSYCHRYRIAARTGAGADSSTGHVGFRLVFDPA